MPPALSVAEARPQWAASDQGKENVMMDTKGILESYEIRSQAESRANECNKAIVFQALAEAGITRLTVEFDGEGDSGQMQDVQACAGEAPKDVPAVTVECFCVADNSGTLATSHRSLTEAIETLCYDYLEQEHGGWENNDGAFGEFTFDVAGRTIQIEFNGRYSDVHTSAHTF
jgi:hypothetical protein